jgi:hypothetical protein
VVTRSIAGRAAHVTDVARLLPLALEKHEDGAKYHAVAEEGVPLRDIAEALGRGLNVPLVSSPAIKPPRTSAFSERLRFRSVRFKCDHGQRLGWDPTGPGMIGDLDPDALRSSDLACRTPIDSEAGSDVVSIAAGRIGDIDSALRRN